MRLRPFRLLPSFREKVWGSTKLEPWFPNWAQKIGEVWFGFDENRTSLGATVRELMERHGEALLGTAVTPGYRGCFPILVKFIFTSERLSVQVHPEDAYSQRHENSPGKTEMWHLLRTEPGAEIAAGFRRPLTRERLIESAASGEIERLIEWFDVRPGQTFFTPPGTVHALGAGLALCEIQQNSDITYRLYDYGRPRPLHVEKAAEVACLDRHPGPAPAPPRDGKTHLLASCRYFATELLQPAERSQYRGDPERFHLLMVLEGSGTAGSTLLAPGEVWLVPASTGEFVLLARPGTRLLRIQVPPA